MDRRRRDRINYFYPYNSRNENHEDHLTRAFLALFNLLPTVQALLIDAIREAQLKIITSDSERVKSNESELLLPSHFRRDSKINRVRTQQSSLGSEKGKILSVLLSDEKLHDGIELGPSDRTAIYDGIINYETEDQEWILVIENKPNVNNVWEEQLKPSITNKVEAKEAFEIVDYPVSLQWKQIIDALYGLIESDSASKGEKGLIHQFFDYVNDQYPGLNPYDTFEKCQNREVLLQKRCEQIMEMFTSEGLGKHRGWKSYFDINDGAVKRATLFPRLTEEGSWKIGLAIYPGDTISQARNFYRNLSAEPAEPAEPADQGIASLIEVLQSNKWEAFTNLHFSFISSHLYWSYDGAIELKDYLVYWRNNKSEIRQYSQKEGSFNHVYDRFLKQGLISNNDISELKAKFDQTNRSTMNICPGVGLEKYWDKKEVLQLENSQENGFAEAVRDQLNTIISCWSNTRIELIED